MKAWRRRTLLAGAAALPRAAFACNRMRVAEMSLGLVEAYPLLPAVIAGQAVSLLLDTGADGMLITPAMADALHLPLQGMTRIYGTGGSQEARIVLVAGLTLGGATMPAQAAPVVALPIDLRTRPPLAGLLGASLLSQFDLELDVGRQRMALYLPSTCPAPLDGTTLPIALSSAGVPFVEVHVNGQRLLAIVDTGSRATLIDTAAARRLGISAPISANTARGIDGERLPLEHVQVQLALGDEAPRPAPASISLLRLERGDMLLGLDVLAQRPMWLLYGQSRVTFGRPEPR